MFSYLITSNYLKLTLFLKRGSINSGIVSKQKCFQSSNVI